MNVFVCIFYTCTWLLLNSTHMSVVKLNIVWWYMHLYQILCATQCQIYKKIYVNRDIERCKMWLFIRSTQRVKCHVKSSIANSCLQRHKHAVDETTLKYYLIIWGKGIQHIYTCHIYDNNKTLRLIIYQTQLVHLLIIQLNQMKG